MYSQNFAVPLYAILLIHTKRMATPTASHDFASIVRQLSDEESLTGLFHQHEEGNPLPSAKVLAEIVQLARSIIFPGYYGRSTINTQTIEYHVGIAVERLHTLLADQVLAGLCFATDGNPLNDNSDSHQRRKVACEIADKVVQRLPHLREVLATDVEAAYNGDPAAENFSEIISCYPVIKCLTNYRLAHELFVLGVPLIPRVLTEMAHSETGIDIHPGAQIGHHFTIDHGTGVVIGATCIIGNYVKLYQGVTLGAKSFPLDEKGNPIKGIPRHPIIEDEVVIYANATILGRITLGKGTTVGGYMWVTESTAPGTTLIQKK